MDRQRILLIFGVAWVSAAILTWFLWSRTRAPLTEKTTRVVAAARDMAAGTQLRKSDVRLIALPAKDLPRAAVLDATLVEGYALLYPVMANEPLTTHKLSSREGRRWVAGHHRHRHAGRIDPCQRHQRSGRTHPATGACGCPLHAAGSMAEALTTVVLEDAVVLSIGRNTEAAPPAAPQARARRRHRQANLNVTCNARRHSTGHAGGLAQSGTRQKPGPPQPGAAQSPGPLAPHQPRGGNCGIPGPATLHPHPAATGCRRGRSGHERAGPEGMGPLTGEEPPKKKEKRKSRPSRGWWWTFSAARSISRSPSNKAGAMTTAIIYRLGALAILSLATALLPAQTTPARATHPARLSCWWAAANCSSSPPTSCASQSPNPRSPTPLSSPRAK